MIVKNISRNVKDIFFGDTGWEQWGRVEFRRGKWAQATKTVADGSTLLIGSEAVPQGIINFLNRKGK